MVADPTCPTSQTFMELGAAVVREVAKMGGRNASRQVVAYDQQQVREGVGVRSRCGCGCGCGGSRSMRAASCETRYGDLDVSQLQARRVGQGHGE